MKSLNFNNIDKTAEPVFAIPMLFIHFLLSVCLK